MAYPMMKEYYGLLSGLVYNIPYSLLGVVVGLYADKSNYRAKMLSLACLLWSSATVLQGTCDSFLVFSIMRFFHGGLHSINSPTAYSLISDYFPPDKRSTANSLFAAAIYVGTGLSSLNLLVLKEYGWREDLNIIGGLGMLIAFLALLIMEEP